MALTPEEQAQAMEAALDARLPAVEQYGDYYLGRHRIAFATSKWRETYGNLFQELSDNWAQLVVDAAAERLRVEGFRFGPADDPVDHDAWDLWQANYLDADSTLAHTEAIKSGLAYVMVLPGDDPDTPRITVEHPCQVITQHAPEDRRKRVAAFKRWGDDDGGSLAMLYTADAFIPMSSAKDSDAWAQAGDAVDNPIGVVPVVPMLNNPDILGHGVSDLVVVLPLQDAVNKLLADMLVNSEYVAFPQRYATGLEIPTDPDTGRPMDREKWLSSVSRMWVAEDKDVSFGQLSEASGDAYVKQVELLIQHVAAQTRTPPHYLLGSSGNFPSGESLKATETGLVAKVKRKQVTFGEAWEEAMRLAFAYRGDTARASAANCETIWADPESRSEAELVDALQKMRTLGVPLEALWERWGATPQQIERWKVLVNLPKRDAGVDGGGDAVPAVNPPSAQERVAEAVPTPSPAGDTPTTTTGG